jgi:hypothetical protein
MANEEQVALLKQGSEVWNAWRRENPKAEIDLSRARLRHAYLYKADLHNADLRNADLRNADLRNADLRNADLQGAYLIPIQYEVEHNRGWCSRG